MHVFARTKKTPNRKPMCLGRLGKIHMLKCIFGVHVFLLYMSPPYKVTFGGLEVDRKELKYLLDLHITDPGFNPWHHIALRGVTPEHC